MLYSQPPLKPFSLLKCMSNHLEGIEKKNPKHCAVNMGTVCPSDRSKDRLQTELASVSLPPYDNSLILPTAVKTTECSFFNSKFKEFGERVNDKDKSQSVPVVVKWSWDCSDILRCGCPGAGRRHAVGIGELGRNQESEGPWGVCCPCVVTGSG